MFNIDIKEYQNILKSFNAHKFKGSYWFKSKNDCERCVKWLRKLYIKKENKDNMKLIKGGADKIKEDKFAIFQMRDIWCERITETFTEEDRMIQVKVDRDLEGYWLLCAYTNGKMFDDFICQEEVEDCARENEEYPNDEEMALLCCVGWRVDEFKKQGYKGDWLVEND